MTPYQAARCLPWGSEISARTVFPLTPVSGWISFARLKLGRKRLRLCASSRGTACEVASRSLCVQGLFFLSAHFAGTGIALRCSLIGLLRVWWYRRFVFWRGFCRRAQLLDSLFLRLFLLSTSLVSVAHDFLLPTAIMWPVHPTAARLILPLA